MRGLLVSHSQEQIQSSCSTPIGIRRGTNRHTIGRIGTYLLDEGKVRLQESVREEFFLNARVRAGFPGTQRDTCAEI